MEPVEGAPLAADRVEEFRHAVSQHDAGAVVKLLPDVRLAILMRDGQPMVGTDGDGSRILPLFSSMDSFEAFQTQLEPALLPTARLARVLARTSFDVVLLDPALASAVKVPRDDFLALLTGEDTDGEGARVVGPLVLVPDPALEAAVVSALGGDQALLQHVFVGTRPTPAGDVPTVAVTSDVHTDEVVGLRSRLRSGQVAEGLRLVHLDDRASEQARSTWLSAGTAGA